MPTPPPDPKLKLDRDVAQLVMLCRAYHLNGDKADSQARAATDRRTQRKWQTVNKAARAAATAAEVSIFLLRIFHDRQVRAKTPEPVATEHKARLVTDALGLIEALTFEADTLFALKPQPDTRAGKKPRAPKKKG